jgi:hypothetical protein
MLKLFDKVRTGLLDNLKQYGFLIVQVALSLVFRFSNLDPDFAVTVYVVVSAICTLLYLRFVLGIHPLEALLEDSTGTTSSGCGLVFIVFVFFLEIWFVYFLLDLLFGRVLAL